MQTLLKFVHEVFRLICQQPYMMKASFHTKYTVLEHSIPLIELMDIPKFYGPIYRISLDDFHTYTCAYLQQSGYINNTTVQQREPNVITYQE